MLSAMRPTLRSLARVALVAVASASALTAQTAPRDTTDKFRWLEAMLGDSAMAWVRAENTKTSAILEKDPRYEGTYQAALAMAQAKDRLPYVNMIGGRLYNFWQDAAHVRGIWRSTTLASYRTATPVWTTVLDLDALAASEKANWVWQGADCDSPGEQRCLVSLSDGGEDASTVREFDLVTKTFARDGFQLSKGKQRVAWAGRDTLLVAREWQPGDLTTSGYAFIVKRVLRGQSLAQATELFRGSANDGGYGVTPYTLVDGQGHRASFILRPLSTFEFEHYLVRTNDVARLAMPAKARPVELFQGQVIALLAEPWKEGTVTIPSGALAAFDVAKAQKTPTALAPVSVYAPGPRESVSGAAGTRAALLVGVDRNVQGTVQVFTRTASGVWAHRPMALPANVSTSVVAVDRSSARAFVSVTGYLTPSSILLADAATATARPIKSLAPRFDASKAVVEQFEATSNDGTKVPYYVVHPQAMPLDGANPTILYAYGGFEVSLTPSYNANAGKLWVERGGAFVVANIRGGGEFGPAWHDAGLKAKRQVIYDDFAAVARDLIARKITSPRRLGIMGGSNGGLLMGVEMTQHPELFNAVDIQVPLLDMLRFEQIQAGSSWVGEYGSVSKPDERAFLASISPFHNLRPGVTYPTPLIWTTTKDDRVGPQHARKFAAKMADLGMPYLFYEVIEGGHGSGANAEQQAHTTALEYTYFMRQLMGGGGKVVP